MMRSRIPFGILPSVMSAFLTVATGTALLQADEASKDKFRPLFNGTDLSGWVLVNTPPETWSIKDGMLVCTGKPIGEIRTEKMYQNFVLEVEWRHMVPGGNAGIFVWADDITARGVPFHRSIEVQVLENAYGQSAGHTTHGDIFPIHGATMTPMNGRGGGSRAFPTEERSRPSPEWNHYRIECRDGEISLAVNGKLVTRGRDASPRKGYVCLESEGGVVHYRNLKIQELPETPVDEKHVAVANRGYRSLYTGLNLNGWEVSDEGRSHWKANDWNLTYDGKAAADQATLSTSEEFSDFGFVADVRDAEQFKSLQILLGDAVITTLEAQKPGDWRRLEGTVTDNILNLSINGKEVLSNATLSGRSGKLRLKPMGPVSLANIYVRPLSK